MASWSRIIISTPPHDRIQNPINEICSKTSWRCYIRYRSFHHWAMHTACVKWWKKIEARLVSVVWKIPMGLYSKLREFSSSINGIASDSDGMEPVPRVSEQRPRNECAGMCPRPQPSCGRSRSLRLDLWRHLPAHEVTCTFAPHACKFPKCRCACLLTSALRIEWPPIPNESLPRSCLVKMQTKGCSLLYSFCTEPVSWMT